MYKYFFKSIRKYQLKAVVIYWLFIPFLVLGFGKLIDYAAGLQFNSFLTAGVVLIIGGGLLIRQAIQDLFYYGNGTPSPYRPCKNLVTKGVYKYCRHPMWLGYDLMALGVILLLGSLGSLLISFPVFIIIQVLFLRKEERTLKAKFKRNYKSYQLQTGMLFPFIFPIKPKKGDN